ncbi:hypothetical protein CB1_000474001 [Camelus ferus]|nr:hypothetical protein CB1_000474001 [Camelus ferus]
MKTIEDTSLMFTVDVKANEHQVKQAVKELYDIDVAKVNTGSGLMARRHMFDWLLAILWMLPTKLGSPKFYDAFSFKHGSISKRLQQDTENINEKHKTRSDKMRVRREIPHRRLENGGIDPLWARLLDLSALD